MREKLLNLIKQYGDICAEIATLQPTTLNTAELEIVQIELLEEIEELIS